MTVIVQLSDTHFGTEVSDVVKAAKAAVHEIAPDLIVLSGDITQRAYPAQFRAAKDFMASLPSAPRLFIPGNHDLPLYNMAVRMLLPYHHYRRHFGARDQVWCNGTVGVVGIDATSPFRHTRGKVSFSRVGRLVEETRCKLSPGALLIACVHQPLQTAWPEDSHNLLINTEETARVLSTLGIDAMLTGHVHVPLLTTTRKNFPALGRHFVLGGAGTALSHRVRRGVPNSFNVLRAAPEQMSLVEYRFDAETKTFIAAPAMDFYLGEDGWMASWSME
jgi:3',5'-cyclic AMP phosphodiesterase CpdA